MLGRVADVGFAALLLVWIALALGRARRSNGLVREALGAVRCCFSCTDVLHAPSRSGHDSVGPGRLADLREIARMQRRDDAAKGQTRRTGAQAAVPPTLAWPWQHHQPGLLTQDDRGAGALVKSASRPGPTESWPDPRGAVQEHPVHEKQQRHRAQRCPHRPLNVGRARARGQSRRAGAPQANIGHPPQLALSAAPARLPCQRHVVAATVSSAPPGSRCQLNRRPGTRGLGSGVLDPQRVQGHPRHLSWYRLPEPYRQQTPPSHCFRARTAVSPSEGASSQPCQRS